MSNNNKNSIGKLIHHSLPKEKIPLLTETQIEKLKTASQIALAIIAAGGILTLSVIAPNACIAIDKLFLRKAPNRRMSRRERERKLTRTFYYLKERRFIRMKPTGRDFKIYLTSLGREKVQKINFDAVVVPKKYKWDGKWWQVAADIPTEEYKWAADLFRKKLRDMKFFPLQRTLWFFPYDPRGEIDFVVHYFGIESFVTVMEVNRLDEDDENKMKDFFEENKVI